MNIFQKKGKFIIFKHSITCPYSAAAKEVVQQYKGPLEVITIIVQKEPKLKLEIAEKYKVRHESPQILVIHNQKCIENFNHDAITADKINNLK